MNEENAQLAGMLLGKAAAFFRQVGEQNRDVQEEMNNNAEVYEAVEKMIAERDEKEYDFSDIVAPEVGIHTLSDMAAKLLTDAAIFLKNVGIQNPESKDQMDENAGIFDQVAGMLNEGVE